MSYEFSVWGTPEIPTAKLRDGLGSHDELVKKRLTVKKAEIYKRRRLRQPKIHVQHWILKYARVIPEIPEDSDDDGTRNE